MEMVPPSTGSSGGEGDSTTTRVHKTKSESSTSNKSWVQVQGGCGIIIGDQGRGGWGRYVNRPEFMSSILNFKVEVDDFVMVLGTTT